MDKFEIYEQAKLKDFEQYKDLTNHRIEYTGLEYIVLDGDKFVTAGRTNEEIYSYIVGYLNAYKKYHLGE